MADFVDEIETKELIEKLIKHGHGHIVDAFLLNDTKCYTKKGRLNKSGVCRVLDYKPKQLDDSLAAMKKLLDGDLADWQP